MISNDVENKWRFYGLTSEKCIYCIIWKKVIKYFNIESRKNKMKLIRPSFLEILMIHNLINLSLQMSFIYGTLMRICNFISWHDSNMCTSQMVSITKLQKKKILTSEEKHIDRLSTWKSPKEAIQTIYCISNTLMSIDFAMSNVKYT